MGVSPSSSSSPKPSLYAVPCEDQPKAPNATPVFRSLKATEGLLANFDPPFSTLYQVFKTACSHHPSRPCLGEQRAHSDGNRYEWLSYEEVDLLARKTARFIEKEGLASEGGLVSIMGPNCNAWVVTDLALNLLGLASVPFFQALAPEARLYILEETEVTSLFGSNADIFALLQHGSLARLKHLICFQPVSQDLASLAASLDSSLVLFDFWEQIGKQEAELLPALSPPGLDTLFTICYTSGTTGVPKGACISNGNMIASIKCRYEVQHGSPEDCLISYLPLAISCPTSLSTPPSTAPCEWATGEAVRRASSKTCSCCSRQWSRSCPAFSTGSTTES